MLNFKMFPAHSVFNIWNLEREHEHILLFAAGCASATLFMI